MKNVNDVKAWMHEQFENPCIDGCAWLPLIDNLCLVCGAYTDEDCGNIVWRFKLACNCDDLQCDYEWDWEMPYNEETGEVWDTDMEFECEDTGDAEWYLNQALEMSLLNRFYGAMYEEQDELDLFLDLIEDGFTLDDIERFVPEKYEYSKAFMEEHGLI